MFHKVFVEEDIVDHPRTQKILSRLKTESLCTVRRFDDIWGRVKKPYLHKRDECNVFIAKKRGQLVKRAPDAYGQKEGEHYYFIHAFNCIYECEYCYLQGYFQTPDLVFFINHEDILAEIESILENSRTTPWFHGGEFSDSLALSHLTQELEVYFNFFNRHPKAVLELRTKSANLTALNKLGPAPNIIVSYSLSPSRQIKEMDQKTPSLKSRLKAIGELGKRGYFVGIHFDPIVDAPNLTEEYGKLVEELFHALPLKQLSHLSLGVVRFTPSVYRQVEKNYPCSQILRQELTKGKEGMVRYSYPHRQGVLAKVKNLCLERGVPEEKIYLCMEP